MSSVTSALPKQSANPGVLREDSRAKMRGKSPRIAIARGSSPCRRIQPFRAPNALIAAKTASILPAPSPQNCAARSTNGAFDLASVSGGSNNKTVVHAIAQISAVTTVPSNVAMGMARPGSATLSAGMVADSRPNKAHSVKVAAAVTPPTDRGMEPVADTWCERTNNNPKTATANKGRTLRTVVTLCTQPDALIPYQLTNVSIHKKNKVTAADAAGVAPIQGSSEVR